MKFCDYAEGPLDSTLAIEIAAALLAAGVVIYIAARGLRVRRIAALFYYRPKRDPVPLASILKGMFPDAHLSGREREQLLKYGIERGGPPWTEWIHRHNLAKLSIISKSGESGWSGAVILHRIHETDGDLTESLSHLIHRRLEAFADLRKPPLRKAPSSDQRADPEKQDRLYAEPISLFLQVSRARPL